MNGTENRSTGQGEQDRLEALGRVAGQLFHDLIGATALLRGSAELMRDEVRRGHVPGEEVEIVCEHAMYLERMVADVFEEVRGSGDVAGLRFALIPTIESTIERWMSAAPSCSIDLRQEVAEAFEIRGRATFFSRALHNLLNNAARHGRRRIEVRVSQIERDGQAWIAVDVEDDGEGVPVERHPFLFTPFNHGGHGGTGLGLSYVNWAIEGLGGTVEHRRGNRLGGARFRVCIPAARRLPNGTARSGSRHVKPIAGDRLAGLSVVVVDDDESLLRFYRKLFVRGGAEVTALRAFGDERDGTLPARTLAASPDVILLDRQLGGSSSDRICGEILQGNPALRDRIAFLTGGGRCESEQGRSEIPVLDKMMDVRTLIAEVARLGG